MDRDIPAEITRSAVDEIARLAADELQREIDEAILESFKEWEAKHNPHLETKKLINQKTQKHFNDIIDGI